MTRHTLNIVNIYEMFSFRGRLWGVGNSIPDNHESHYGFKKKSRLIVSETKAGNFILSAKCWFNFFLLRKKGTYFSPFVYFSRITSFPRKKRANVEAR